MSVNYDLNNTGPEVQERLDQVLTNRDAISEEEAARQQRDNEIIAQMKSYTDAEQSRAEGAEQGLRDAIGEEEAARQQRDNEIIAQMKSYTDAEQSRAEGAEQYLRDYTDVETARAQATERGLQGRIDTLDVVVGEGGSVDVRISEAVASETRRAQDIESSQQSRITELEGAVGTGGSVDSRITDAVNTERQRATAAEATKADKSDTYTKAEVNSLITTPDQQYVTVGSYSELPATGAANTIYRVANWDGSQVDSTKYAEYAWTGSAYQLLSVKEGVSEAIVGYYTCSTAATTAEKAVTAAGYAIPTSGGAMKIKMTNANTAANATLNINDTGAKPLYYNDARANASNTWEADEVLSVYYDGTNYQATDFHGIFATGEKLREVGIDDEPTAGSDNLVKSGGAAGTYGGYTENPEFIRVVTDNEGKILYAVRTNGDFYFGAGVPQQIIDYVIEHNNATKEELIDIINTLDDTKVDKEDGKSLIDAEYADGVQYIEENPEFIEAKTDKEGRLLEGFNTNGEKVFGVLPPQIKDYVDEVIASIPQDDLKETFKYIEDPEGRLQIGLDAEEKIINYRKEDGTLVENAGIETNHLELTDEGMSNFQKAIKGFVDFSSNEVVELPEPKHFAALNLHLVGGLPRREGEVINGYAEYYDFAGNSFKKSCSVEIQGQTSSYYAIYGGKGNYTLDITDGSEIKFGSWVPQDSFHLKGSAKDVTRGLLSTSYKLAYKLIERLDAKPNRALFENDSKTTTRYASGDRFTDWGDSARCLSDGFPIEVYLEGKYWGLYALQLKKHRKNYSMKKSDYTTVLVESANYMSDSYQDGFWAGDIWWNNIEIRNPKDLVLKNGGTYDNDVRGELMGKKNVVLNNTYWKYTGNGTDVEPVEGLWDAETEYAIDDTAWMADDTGEWWYEFKAIDANTNEPCLNITNNEYYDSSIKVHKNTVITKGIINSYPKRYIEVKNLIAEGKIEDYEIDGVIMPGAKTKFKENFDYNACMVVFFFNGLIKNGDSVKKNTLWGVYKNGKIAPMLWDLDGAYGESFTGTSAGAPGINVWTAYTGANWPLKSFWVLFEDDIKATYATLRREGVISMDTWRDVIYNQWVNRIGAEAYERDIEKWPDTPSYRENNLNSEYWATTGEDYTELAEWDENTEYNVGDRVYYTYTSDGIVYHSTFRAVKAGSNKVPLTKIYSYPTIGGYFNSPKRMEKWMAAQLALCDAYMEYHE